MEIVKRHKEFELVLKVFQEIKSNSVSRDYYKFHNVAYVYFLCCHDYFQLKITKPLHCSDILKYLLSNLIQEASEDKVKYAKDFLA